MLEALPLRYKFRLCVKHDQKLKALTGGGNDNKVSDRQDKRRKEIEILIG